MIKTYLISAIIFYQIVTVNTGYCQNIPKIDISDLIIVRANKSIPVNFSSSKNKVIAAFGKPVATKRSYFVKFDFRGEKIEYEGAEFLFCRQSFRSIRAEK